MSPASNFILLILMFAIMYFLIIRPQKKREKETNTMRANISVGDEIVTIGGICGKVVKTKDETLVIQVGADKTKFEVMRWSISRVVSSDPKAAGKKDRITEEEEAPKKVMPKRMKKAAPVEEAAEVAAPVEEAIAVASAVAVEAEVVAEEAPAATMDEAPAQEKAE